MKQLTIDELTGYRKENGQFQPKQYNITAINKAYLTAFQSAKYPDIQSCKRQRLSWHQYNSTLSRFLEWIKRDAANIKRQHIDDFLLQYNNSKTKYHHIKSFYVFIITANVEDCRTKVSRDLLIKIIEM